MNSINTQTQALKQPSTKELSHAFRVVKEQINAKRREMATATGEDRAKLDVEIKNLLASIGLDVSQLEIEPESSATSTDGSGEAVGAKLLVGLANLTSKAAELTGDAAENLAKSVPVEKPGLWARFKAWVAANKKKTIAGALTVFAGAAGLWYWLSGKNINTAVSSVSGVTDTAADPTAQIPAEEAGASIFNRIGEWFVEAGVAVKGWAVSAWNWIKGLFNRNTTITEATGEATPEAVPAGA